MAPNEEQHLHPAQHHADRRQVPLHLKLATVVAGEHDDEGEADDGELHDVLGAEEVPLEGREHLERLSQHEYDAEEGQNDREASDGRLGRVVELVHAVVVVVVVIAGRVNLQLGSAEPQKDEGGEKEDEGDVEHEVGEPEGPDALPLQPQETGDDGVLQERPVLLGRYGEVPQRLCLRQRP